MRRSIRPIRSKGTQDTRQFFESAGDVVKPHNISYIFIQACIAILILVGFESVTSMGEEAKNAKRDIPRAVLLSLFIQGVICYLIEYFAANFLEPGYTMTDGARFECADRRHDEDRRRVAVRSRRAASGSCISKPSRCSWPSSARRSPASTPGSRHLCDGPRRRSAFALRHVARQEPHAAPGDLDVGGDLDGDRDLRGHLADRFADGID